MKITRIISIAAIIFAFASIAGCGEQTKIDSKYAPALAKVVDGEKASGYRQIHGISGLFNMKLNAHTDEDTVILRKRAVRDLGSPLPETTIPKPAAVDQE